MSAQEKSKPVLVKRHARSRLYDSEKQRYISIEQLRGWAAEGLAFVVLDAETGADVTDALVV
jgi:polyhydroxyalkanoate synthesis regulator protein